MAKQGHKVTLYVLTCGLIIRMEIHPNLKHKIKVIPQGFNIDKTPNPDYSPLNSIPTLVYTGTFYRKLINPSALLNYLSSLEREFKSIIYTKNVDLVRVSPYLDKLKEMLVINSYVSRDTLIEK